MHKLKTALRRLDDHWIGDLIGVTGLFCLVPIVLFLGTVFGGGR